MKIAFFQREWFENIGIMTLAAVLQQAGHEVEIFIFSAEKFFWDSVKSYNPHLACFSCTTGEHLWALETAKRLKEQLPVFILLGGHHPTFFPDIVNNPQVDAICRGEGEYALLELAQALEQKHSPQHIANLWIKDNGHLIKNDLRPLVENLDELPLPLRSIYDKYPGLQHKTTKHFMASRGCPCNCSFCYAQGLRALYRGKGSFVRYRSPNHVIDEIKYAQKKYPLRTVYFEDDIFIFHKKWLFDLLDQYKKEIGLPFICNVWANGVTDEICYHLKQAGCCRVSMGLETGNEKLRKDILLKNTSNEQIITAAKHIHNHGIALLTNSMIGLPGETIEQAFETVKLNTLIKTDYPWCSIMQPYPETLIEKIAVDKGLLAKGHDTSFATSFFKSSPLSQKNMRQLISLQKIFFLAVKFPGLEKLFRFLIKLPLTPLYDVIFLITFAHRHRVSNKLTLKEMFIFCCHNFSLYKQSPPT